VDAHGDTSRLALEPSLTVFAPSPVVTITVEQGSRREPEIHIHAGGQGFWVARMAARLGARVSLCAPLGGETGEVLKSLLAADGITVLSIPVSSSNGAYVHDRRRGEREEIAQTASPALARHELDDLYGVTITSGLESDAVLVTGPRNEGVLPAGIYERLCRDLRRNDCRVLADLSGEVLGEAVRGGVDLLKVSDEDLVAEGRLADRDRDATAEVAHRLHDAGASSVLISRGREPALVLSEGRVMAVDSPHFTPVDEHGAGDSMFAGLGLALGAGLPLETAVKFGAAAGALNVARRGLGTGHLREVVTLAEQVRVEPLEPAQPGAGEDPAASTAS
jgi:1-phosphofructokinase